ncbi:MAG: hypothetical protein WAT19_03485 [Ferruginibacter sp.]
MKSVFTLFVIICLAYSAQSQNVGIGTTNPANAKLVVEGSTSLGQAVFGTAADGNVLVDLFPPKLGFNSYYSSGYKAWRNGFGGHLVFNDANGRFHLQTTTASATAGTAQTFLTGLTVDAAQNVGIGIISPSFKLDVGGRARYRANVLNDLSQTPGAWYDDYRNGTIMAFAGMQDSIRWGLYGNTAGWQFDFNTRSGNVGMGRQASDFARLSLNGNNAIDFYSGASYYGGISYNGTDMLVSSSAGNLFTGTPSKNLLLNPPACTSFPCLFYSGNVGVGVTVPTASFHVGGNVMIGGGNPATGYALSINGKLVCEELKVQLDAAWPDYVFSDNYKLKPLDELEAFIKTKNHLPNIPPAGDVQANGIMVGDMQKRLLEKVEELTLYVIELHKQNKELEQQVNELKTNTVNPKK